MFPTINQLLTESINEAIEKMSIEKVIDTFTGDRVVKGMEQASKAGLLTLRKEPVSYSAAKGFSDIPNQAEKVRIDFEATEVSFGAKTVRIPSFNFTLPIVAISNVSCNEDGTELSGVATVEMDERSPEKFGDLIARAFEKATKTELDETISAHARFAEDAAKEVFGSSTDQFQVLAYFGRGETARGFAADKRDIKDYIASAKKAKFIGVDIEI